MKKNKLIELLNSIDGNPDIVIWNGHVQDWMPIDNKLVDSMLYRKSFESYLKSIQFEKMRDANDWTIRLTEDEIISLKKSYKEDNDWEIGEFVSDEDIKENRYESKKVVFLQPKSRCVSTFDRLGPIEY